MRIVFQQELEEVQGKLVEISTLVSEAIEKAVTAFNESNVHLAEEVIDNDDRIDELASDLTELSIMILAKQQPVARDLRTIVSTLRITASVERMGDLAAHVAQLARYRFPDRVVPGDLRDTFMRLGALDVAIAKKVPELLATQDLELAEAIRQADDEVDALHKHVFDTVLSDEWKNAALDTVDVTLASRYHERFADHAVNIANMVIYLATGDWANESDESDSSTL
ncbi:MAG: phosphate signaling complex protein PhoU [Pseudoclavibacter sp.]